MLHFLKNIFSKKNNTNWKSLYQSGAIIVDVRSAGEYKSGHIKGSINVPLQNLHHQVSALKKMNKPIITCCLSGARSGSAKRLLQQAGLEVFNGGSWFNLQEKIN